MRNLLKIWDFREDILLSLSRLKNLLLRVSLDGYISYCWLFLSKLHNCIGPLANYLISLNVFFFERAYREIGSEHIVRMLFLCRMTIYFWRMINQLLISISLSGECSFKLRSNNSSRWLWRRNWISCLRVLFLSGSILWNSYLDKILNFYDPLWSRDRLF